LNLTHLNPNSILQVSVFVHLCESYLGILPHFGLWKYLYHFRPGMAGGQHQLVGVASLEMRCGRKTEYLDIPLKDNIKGWRLEWFIVENHGNSIPPRSVRQPDVRAPSWTESPKDLEIAEARVLLAEVGLLKEKGLTTEAMVADFIFKNIQPLKDRAYPAYLYRGVTDSTRVTNRRIPAMDLVSRLEMILRGKVSNVGAPVAYSAWNLPPPKTFISFVSNPPVGDSGLGLRVRPSSEEVEAFVASLGGIPNDERQVHFEMPTSPSDAEISAMLDMLAEDSSDSAPAETLAVALILESGKTLDIQRPDTIRPKRLHQASHPTSPAEGKKKKKRRLRRVSSLNQNADPSALATREVPVPVFVEAEPNGCDSTDADPNGCDPIVVDPNGCGLDDADPNGCDPIVADPNGCGLDDADPNGCTIRIIDEDEEEEEEIPLIQKNSRHYIASGESSGVPSPALSALIGLQELSLANFDQTLEDMVPEDMLSEPADGEMMEVCADVPDAGLELSRAASRASSTLERGLKSREADLDCSVPMEVVESPSALEVAVTENSVPKDDACVYLAPKGVAGDDPARMGSASYDLAPEGVQAGSLSHTSMDVHVGSSPPHSGCMAAARASGQEVALEAGAPDDRVLISAGDANLVPTDALQIALVGNPSSSHQLNSHDLGVPSFFSNLQVIWFFLT
jgi:hypothetical protein